jgi:hypothetical protein
MIMATHMGMAMADTAMATGTATDMVVTDTGTVTTTATTARTALPLDREWLSYNGDSRALAIITDQLTEF